MFAPEKSVEKVGEGVTVGVAVRVKLEVGDGLLLGDGVNVLLGRGVGETDGVSLLLLAAGAQPANRIIKMKNRVRMCFNIIFQVKIIECATRLERSQDSLENK